MLEYQMGDSASFNELYGRYSPRVYQYLRRRLNNAQECDEVFQTIFTKVHSSRRQYRSEFTFAQWLFVIVKTGLMDYWRKQGRGDAKVKAYELYINHFDGMNDKSYFGAQQDQLPEGSSIKLDAIKEALDSLPEKQKQALQFRYFEEWDYEKIAEQLNASEVGARKLVSRAMAALKLKLFGLKSSEGGPL